MVEHDGGVDNGAALPPSNNLVDPATVQSGDHPQADGSEIFLMAAVVQRYQIEEEEEDIFEDAGMTLGLREIPECEEDEENGSPVGRLVPADEDDDLPDVPDEASSVLAIDAGAYDHFTQIALCGQSRGLMRHS